MLAMVVKQGRGIDGRERGKERSIAPVTPNQTLTIDTSF